MLQRFAIYQKVIAGKNLCIVTRLLADDSELCECERLLT